jgi:hypothetical protein
MILTPKLQFEYLNKQDNTLWFKREYFLIVWSGRDIKIEVNFQKLNQFPKKDTKYLLFTSTLACTILNFYILII